MDDHPTDSHPDPREPAHVDPERRSVVVRERWSAPGAGTLYALARWRDPARRERDPRHVGALLERHAGRLGAVLDAPCGTGRLHAALAARAERYVGLDVSPEMLASARAGAGSASGPVPARALVRGDALALPFRTGSFEAVVCCRLLHHLRDEAGFQRSVDELVRVSTRWVVVTFWDAGALPERWRRRFGAERAARGRVARSRAAVRRAFARAGARVLEFRATLPFLSRQTYAVACKLAAAEPRALPAAGRLIVRGDAALAAALAPELHSAASAGRSGVQRVRIGDERLFLKLGPLRGRASWRHALRRLLLGRVPPRLQEFENLAWLRAHGFGAPEPRAAGALLRRGLPRFQFLATAEVPDALTLDGFLRAAPEHERAEVVGLLARELARLHALRFVHRDLYPRNVLVQRGSRQGLRLVLLDAWRGGARRGLRGRPYDLACLWLEGATLFSAAEERAFFDAYFEALARAGCRVKRSAWLAAAARARRALLPREARRHPGSAFAPSWSPR